MAETEDLRWGEDEENEDSMANRYLLFNVASEEYGIGIENVIEIVGLQKITEVPEMPHHVKGVINLRGQVIPVLDVRLRFGIEPMEYGDRTCVIVVQLGEIQAGMIVDQVSEVRNIAEESVSAPPSIQSSMASEYIDGLARIEESVIILLDVMKLLGCQDLKAMAGI